MTQFLIAAFCLLWAGISLQAALTELETYSLQGENVGFKKYLNKFNLMSILRLVRQVTIFSKLCLSVGFLKRVINFTFFSSRFRQTSSPEAGVNRQ